MQKSESIVELAKALVELQGKLPSVKKTATNPFFKSKYATLDTIWETIRKPLSESGLAIVQSLNQIGELSLLETTLMHTSGEWMMGSMLVNPVKDDPQGLGSAISYARRYSLCAILGIVSDEDDDGNVATKPTSKPKPKDNPAEVNIDVEQPKDGITPEQLFDFIATNMKWKTPTAARSWIVNKCKIEEARIDEDTPNVYEEIKQLQGW